VECEQGVFLTFDEVETLFAYGRSVQIVNVPMIASLQQML
jgi:hypothetical protein